MFGTLGRSWEFAKISYGMIWQNKQLIVFPLLSTLAAILVLASFALPLWQTGTLEQWTATKETATTGQSGQIMMWITLFLFYFCNYTYASGRTLPREADANVLADAFAQKE